jgi:hypothetical protein
MLLERSRKKYWRGLANELATWALPVVDRWHSDGKPAQALEYVEDTQGQRLTKIVHQFVHVDAAGKPLPDGEGHGGHGNGKDGAN